MSEIWAQIGGTNGMYHVSNTGRVFSSYTGADICMHEGKGGYMGVILYIKRKPVKALVHRLVAAEFADKPAGCNYVNHKDGDRQNNIWHNLEWVTQSENIRHMYAMRGEGNVSGRCTI